MSWWWTCLQEQGRRSGACSSWDPPSRVTAPTVRKVVEMASEYKLPPLGFVENQQNAVTGEAGHRLAEDYGLPLLVQIPWTPEIPMAMDIHEPFNHQVFLPVAEAAVC